MREVFRLLNQLKRKRIVKDYAIGGGIAALAYIEPVLTYDIDVFVVLKPKQGKVVILSPLYDYLKGIGYKRWEGEHIIIGGQRVQFFPADRLEAEAIANAKVRMYQRIRVRVVSPEYLIALLVRAGRPKDRIKVRMLLDQAKIDRDELGRVLRKHRLISKYKAL